jgi:uncharacterized membrane protein
VKLKHPVLRGHPVHAMLSDGPLVLIPLAASAALGARARRDLRGASRRSAGLAAASAVAAIAVGWWDWLTIPREHEARGPATLHGLLNTAATAATLLAIPLDRRRAELLGAATALLVASAWIGGDLVYRLGWRVRPAEELELIAEDGPPHLERYRAAARGKIERHEREDTFLPEAPSRA